MHEISWPSTKSFPSQDGPCFMYLVSQPANSLRFTYYSTTAYIKANVRHFGISQPSILSQLSTWTHYRVVIVWLYTTWPSISIASKFGVHETRMHTHTHTHTHTFPHALPMCLSCYCFNNEDAVRWSTLHKIGTTVFHHQVTGNLIRLVNATPRPLCPRERHPAPILQDARQAPGLVWTGVENLDPELGFESRTVQHAASRFVMHVLKVLIPLYDAGQRINFFLSIRPMCTAEMVQVDKRDQYRCISYTSVWSSHWFLIMSVTLGYHIRYNLIILS